MPRPGTLVRLPDEITLRRDEAAEVLGALDEGAAAVPPAGPAQLALRAAARIITAKLWPELGDLLAEDDAPG